MDMVTLQVPITIANVGKSIKYLDKASFFAAIKKFGHYTAVDNSLDQMPLYNQYVITSENIISETAEIAMSQELFQALANEGVLESLNVSYLCSLSPMVTTPMWTVTDVHDVFLSVCVQAAVRDFVSPESYEEPKEEEH